VGEEGDKEDSPPPPFCLVDFICTIPCFLLFCVSMPRGRSELEFFELFAQAIFICCFSHMACALLSCYSLRSNLWSLC
jgi:hypothetical protein